MIKQVTVTDLQRRAAEVISNLAEGPIVINQHGHPAAVIVTAKAYEQMEQALAEVEANQVREIIAAGLSSYRARRTSSQATVSRRVRARRRKKWASRPMPRVVWTEEAEEQLTAIPADETVEELLALAAGLPRFL